MSFPISTAVSTLLLGASSEPQAIFGYSTGAVVAVVISAGVLVLTIARSRRAVAALMLASGAGLLVAYVAGGVFSSQNSRSVRSTHHVHQPAASDHSSGTAQVVMTVTDGNSQPALEAGNTPVGSIDLTGNRPVAPSPPAWVGKPDRTMDGVHIHVVKVGPYVTEIDGQSKLAAEAERYSREYIERTVSPAAAAQVSIDPGYLNKNVIAETWAETSNHEFGGETQPMVVLHARLEYTPETRTYFENQWAAFKAERNLFGIGIIALAFVGVAGTVFSYFRLDTATKGYYTMPLKLAAAAVGVSICVVAWYFGANAWHASGASLGVF